MPMRPKLLEYIKEDDSYVVGYETDWEDDDSVPEEFIVWFRSATRRKDILRDYTKETE